MGFFKPWAWLSSSERRQKKQELNSKIDELTRALKEVLADEEEPEQDDWEDEEENEEEEEQGYPNGKPYRYITLSDDTVTVVMHDGETFTKEDADADFYYSVKDCTDEEQIYDMFYYSKASEKKEVPTTLETEEERRIVKENIAVLKVHDAFVVDQDRIYLKGVGLEMPAVVAATFIEIVEKLMLTKDVKENIELGKRFEALKMFWYWTALNPIESSRRDLLMFVKNNDIRITKNGLLEMYRRVVSKGVKNKELVNFVSNAFYRVSRWGYNTSDYRIVEIEGNYLLENIHDFPPKGEVIGSLDTLYNNLPTMNSNSFTDAHTRTMDIKVGEVYAIEEDKIDLDNLQSCSAGLHVGSRSFMFGGFGDVGVLALVNPSKVRAVPVYDGNKMRVSEMFIAAVVDLDEYSKSVDETDVTEFSNQYFNTSVEELAQAVKERNFSSFNCQGNTTILDIMNIQEIVNTLQSKVVVF